MMEMTVACKFGNWVKGEKDFNYCIVGADEDNASP